MKARDFEFNKKRLSSFGFIICSFNNKGLETIDGVKITFNTIPIRGGSKNYLTSTQYEDCLTTTIQICRNPCNCGDMEISSTTFRELTKWLCQKKFLKFKLLSEEYIDLYFESIINVSKIELDGKIVGLELEITCNRPFALKEPRIITINCEKGEEVYGWKKYKIDPEIEMLGYVTSTDATAYPQGKVDENNNIIEGEHTDGYQYIAVGQVYKASLNDTSYEEGYIYPEMEVVIGDIGNQKKNLTIHNSIENRESHINNCASNEVITMDYPVIKSSDSSHNIQNDFNWNFFRVANTYENSRNDLTISLPCLIKIKYSPIVKVGL